MYVPGISTLGNEEFDAEARGRNSFPADLFQAFDNSGYQSAWFSYRSTGSYQNPGQYLPSETRQSLDLSAQALDEQISDLINMATEDHPDGAIPEIVIVAHSLGGAVAARWAASADGQTLDAVKTVVTFDSPVAGIDLLRGLFGGDAGDDLSNPTEIARLEHGAERVDFAQVGNLLDALVPWSYSFTPEPWRQLTVSCNENVTGHDCSKQTAVDDGFLDATLSGTPPIWSGAITRPGPLPDEFEITDLTWTDSTGNEIDSVERGDVVSLAATGNGIFQLTLTARILEVDFGFNDQVAVIPMEFLFFSGKATWTAVWMADGLVGGPEYVFRVLGFESPELKVN